MMNVVFKNEELCIKNQRFCIKTEIIFHFFNCSFKIMNFAGNQPFDFTLGAGMVIKGSDLRSK